MKQCNQSIPVIHYRPSTQARLRYIGLHRTWGGVIAGGFFVLPSLFILIGLSWVHMAFGSVPTVAGVLYGIKPTVTAIVVFVAYRIGSRALKNAWLNPDASSLAASYAILDDKERLYYEHRLAA